MTFLCPGIRQKSKPPSLSHCQGQSLPKPYLTLTTTVFVVFIFILAIFPTISFSFLHPSPPK
ncbi:hypothetical protein BDV23DRAFT_36080 [Aspergillus alliaceus]|uniref:Uncharacterized protein n=1 Tax=Petromyces alliaceus TaxID=209559 RepID=A0A5N7BRP0_PETAA|nr:hypothetical protein BDV23DRAFT_36080 [Aspergillus alliaceus]